MIIKKYITKLNENKHNIIVEDDRIEVKSRNLKYPSEIAATLNEAFDMQNLAEEHVYLLTYTMAGQMTAVFEVSHGLINKSLASAREIFTRALLSGAAYIVIAHNHPSGCPVPGQSDYDVTKLIYNAGCIMNIPLVDHIILGENGTYYSFAERGEMPTTMI